MVQMVAWCWRGHLSWLPAELWGCGVARPSVTCGVQTVVDAFQLLVIQQRISGQSWCYQALSSGKDVVGQVLAAMLLGAAFSFIMAFWHKSCARNSTGPRGCLWRTVLSQEIPELLV